MKHSSDPRGPGAGETRIAAIWRALFPARLQIDLRERARIVIGAALGIGSMASLARAIFPQEPVQAWLLAPMGATAVLVFAAPASPLAQPWAVLAGNAVSAVIGILSAQYLADPVIAAAVAATSALTAMLALRCLHPPGSAIAILAVMIHASGMQLRPAAVALDSIALVAVAMAYHALTGKRYPHVPQPLAAPAAASSAAERFRSEDLDVVLARYNEIMDVDRDDLAALLKAAELEGYRRRIGDITCGQIMSRPPVFARLGSTADQALALLERNHIKALPIVDPANKLCGIVTLADLANVRIQPAGAPAASVPEAERTAIRVDRFMVSDVRSVTLTDHIVDLLPVFTQTGHHHLPVVDAHGTLAGMVTQSDLLRALNQLSPLMAADQVR